MAFFNRRNKHGRKRRGRGTRPDMKKYALDTNCFIDAFNPEVRSYDVLQRILTASNNDKVLLMVSRHTLHELQKRNDRALELAKSLPILPHYPIGVWEEQVCTWEQASGTWADTKRNNLIQDNLKELAKSGTDIRDRGGYIDALCSELDGFVTSDKQLVGSCPSKKINEQFHTKVLPPEQLAEELRL